MINKLLFGACVVMVIGLFASDIYRITVLKQHVYTKPAKVISDGIQCTY